MCAINPKYSASIRFDIFTAHGSLFEFTQEIEKAIGPLLETEVKLNSTTKLRWHLQEFENVKVAVQPIK